jgi:hypothetical protein
MFGEIFSGPFESGSWVGSACEQSGLVGWSALAAPEDHQLLLDSITNNISNSNIILLYEFSILRVSRTF